MYFRIYVCLYVCVCVSFFCGEEGNPNVHKLEGQVETKQKLVRITLLI